MGLVLIRAMNKKTLTVIKAWTCFAQGREVMIVSSEEIFEQRCWSEARLQAMWIAWGKGKSMCQGLAGMPNIQGEYETSVPGGSDWGVV